MACSTVQECSKFSKDGDKLRAKCKTCAKNTSTASNMKQRKRDRQAAPSCETLAAQERGAPPRGGRCCGRVPPMFKGGKKAPQATAPDQSSSQNVHFDWEQRDFTQTIQLGMTQLTAFLNEFGAHRHLTLHPRACCNDWRAVCRWNHARANCSAKR